MKSLISLLILTLTGTSLTYSQCQIIKASYMPDKVEVCESTPATADVKWNEENVAKAHDFYTAHGTFDPAEDYAAIYSKNASQGLTVKTESGKIKVMADNNSAPIVYYNNATVGTILRLINPDNGKTTYAVVVGKVSPTDSQSYMIVLNEKAAKNLSIKEYTTVELSCYVDSVR